MIRPRSRKKRFIYFIGFAVLFAVCAPVLLLYSVGYSINGFSLTKTGGVYVYSYENGVNVYIDDVLAGETSTFQRGVLMKSLKPGTYNIRVYKEGFAEWKKTVTVEDQKVVTAYPFLVHIGADPVILTATSTEYAEAVALFTPDPKKATSTATTTLELYKVNLVKEGDSKLVADWVGTDENTPFYFCLDPILLERACAKRINVYSAPHIGTVDFFPGRNDVILLVVGSRILVTELDTRPSQNTVVLYQSNSQTAELDFRFFDSETIIVRDQVTVKGKSRVEYKSIKL